MAGSSSTSAILRGMGCGKARCDEYTASSHRQKKPRPPISGEGRCRALLQAGEAPSNGRSGLQEQAAPVWALPVIFPPQLITPSPDSALLIQSVTDPVDIKMDS